MSLPYDIARCYGEKPNNPAEVCNRRETCRRYADRLEFGPATIHYDIMCGWANKSFEDQHIP